MTSVDPVNFILGILTVAVQAAVVAGIAAFVVKNEAIIQFFSKHALRIAFATALVATLGSLFYSEIAGYEPCKLCWLQRIFMYPQAIILGMALWKKDRNIVRYSIVLSAVGAVIAAYHYLLQLGIAPALPCAAVGSSAACSQRFVMEFGYITIPLMSLSGFLLILVSMVAAKLRHE